MYWTYGIIDPVTRHFVYVGETGNFERRKSEHLRRSRVTKTRHPKGSIKRWLAQAHAAGITPEFIILELTETEEQSKVSELQWVEKLAAIGQPLLNRWEEHRELIEAGRAGPAETFHAYWPGKWRKTLGTMQPTPKGAGFSLTFPEEITIRKGGRIVLMPVHTLKRREKA